MFQRIVSKLSLSPSAASELTFYARRLKQENVTRTFSAIAAVLILGLQFAVVTAPPTASNAASPNDIVYGGIISKDDDLNHYDSSAQLQALYKYFGVTRQDIVNSHVATINSKDHTLESVGRDRYFSTDQPITVDGTTYWGDRGLYKWDTGANIQRGSTYKVLEGTRSIDGGYFAIMFACGNIVYRNLPPKPTPPPPPKPPTPYPTPTPKTTKPTLACQELIGNDYPTGTSGTGPLTVNYTGFGAATGQTITAYDFDFGDGHAKSQPTAETSHQYTSPGTWIATIKVVGSTGQVSTIPPACKFTVHVTTPPAAFTKTKTALNLTQNIDATTAPANPGDIIRYVLTTKNVGGTSAPYAVVEHLDDVLQYSDLTDAGGGTLDGGVLTWPTTAIAPGAILTENFTVTVKNPVPATPVGISNKFSYDLEMTNVYGNTINVKIQPPLPKQIEVASAQLPDTGAGASTIIVLIVVALSLFFYFRNRQLIAEIKLLRGDYQGGHHVN